MSGRLDKTLADYLAIAVSPVLIMTLVGSLVFFLLEVFYQGGFHGRLQWILAMFVIAAVLIGRISIEEGTERASVFALPLAVLTALAIYRFVTGDAWPLAVSLGLMGLIWWCAHKLTWDCTLIDEDQDASGEGLLQVVGLDQSPAGQESSAQQQPAEPEDPSLLTPDPSPLTSVPWWQRLLEHDKRPHAPGVWIVYFSLAALPVFGIGQRLIPTADAESRRFVFWLLCVYVASGLGLLVTTSFLGLRRYLRQRHLQMPASMAGAWIAIGCLLAVALLVLAALLPRPASEYAVSDLPFGLGALEHKSSPYAMGEEGVQDDQRQPRPGKPAEQKSDEQSGKQSDEQSGEPSAEQSGEQPSEKSRKDASEQSGGNQPGGQAQQGGSKEKDGGGEKSEKGGAPKKGQGKGQKAEGGRQKAEGKGKRTDERGKKGEQQGDARSERQGQEAAEDSESQSAEDQGAESQPSRQPLPSHNLLPHTTGGWLMTLFRWLVYGVVIVVGAVWLWRSRDKVRAGFRELIQWLRAFWQQLFGSKAAVAAAEAEAEQAAAGPELRPFSAFADPFATGLAAQYTPEQLVRYSFEAMEAWAREQGLPRAADETPHEFAARVGSRVAPLARDARRLADLYCSVAYARGRLPAASVDHLRRFWQQLHDVQPAQPTL